MKAMISGWKDGHDVNPITLLGLLRGALELDLPAAKALLDRFAEDDCKSPQILNGFSDCKTTPRRRESR